MTAFLISCENATCAVPEAYREIFRDFEDDVASTEGWEPGALNLAQGFAMKNRTPLVHGDVTRLLIDLEKDGDERWSRFSLKLPEATRVKVAERHEKPYRMMLNQRIGEDLRRHAAVLHLMVHTDATTDGRVTLETPKGGVLAEKIAAACGRSRCPPLPELGQHRSRRGVVAGISGGAIRADPVDRVPVVLPRRTPVEVGNAEKTSN
jgi:hypothetical protein